MSIRPPVLLSLISFSFALIIGIATTNVFVFESEKDFLVRLNSLSKAETHFYDNPGGGKGTASCNGPSSERIGPLDVPAPKYLGNRGNISLKILAKPRPVYSDEARINEIQGTVILRVTFLASKEIGFVQPVKSLPYGLTEEAIEAAKKIRFEPAERNGRPISVTKMVEYNFNIY